MVLGNFPSGRPQLVGGLPGDEGYARPPLRFYRRVPGSRDYYDPVSRERITESAYRRYQQGLEEAERATLNLRRTREGTRAQTQRRNLAESYRLKVAAETGVFLNYNQVYSDPNFKEAVYQVRLGSYNTRYQSAGFGRFNTYNGPQSDYAKALVELGRRNPTDTFNVGESPNGWLDSIMARNEQTIAENNS